MRILVVGAGGVGGYFGGRLLQVGRDVTFLVRPARAAMLAKSGLVIQSPHGDLTIPALPTVTADAIQSHYDVILLSCKAYDLESAMDAIAPAMGPETVILPMLNGMRHLDRLDERFGAERVLGGEAKISAVLDDEGRVIHLNRIHRIAFGERSGERTERVVAIEAACANAGFDAVLTTTILQEMWEKWAFIATGAGATCLLRSTIGDIVSAGAEDIVLALDHECATIAAENGYPPSEQARNWTRTAFTTPGSSLTASMFRDIEARGRIEGEQIISDLLARGKSDASAYPMLRVTQAHLRTYEARRTRESTAS